MQNIESIENVKEYYGQVLQSNADLKTSACCVEESVPGYIKPILSLIHDEVMSTFYGCGSPIPLHLEGKTVLDLGSGSGRDCFVLSKLVGPNGKVIGVDMTDEQLQIAKKHVNFHAETFGYSSSNVEFKKGLIEDLAALDIADNSIDVVVSNCVLNLSTDKYKVFSEIFRVLKPGGELYFSDVFSDRRIPQELVNDPVLYGECLSGALYKEDFRRILAELGCSDSRIMTQRQITIEDEVIAKKLGLINFYSVTVRAFKLALEDRCEDYGQFATYKGGIENSENYFDLDDHHRFEMGRPVAVCSNTARMIQKTRFAEYFEVYGDESTHYGLFECGPEPKAMQAEETGGCC